MPSEKRSNKQGSRNAGSGPSGRRGPDRGGSGRGNPRSGSGRGGSRRGAPTRDRNESPEPSPPTPMDEWVDEGVVDAAQGAVRRGRSGGGRRASKGNKPPSGAARSSRRARGPKVEVPDLTSSVGRQRAQRLEGRVEEAARAFAAERYLDARRILKPIAEEVPNSPEVRELHGLTLYRLGRWKQAAAELEAFSELTGGSVEQHPVLADCYRALGRYGEVDELWDELRDVSPSASLVTEGRIVVAGSLADRGELPAAIQLLAKGFKLPARYSEFHLARAYALADLYERSGDVPQARELFGRLESLEPGYGDVPQRLDALG